MAYYNAFAHATSPFMTVYKQEGSISTKLPNPASLPVGNQSGPSWSPDATYLAMAGTSSPFITIYKRAGDTLTKLAAPADLPPGGAYTTAWSGNGTYLSVIGGTSQYVTVYKRAGDLFTKIANPGPGSIPGGGQGLGWSADSTYMTIGITESPYMHIYKRATDTLTKLSNPAYVPVNTSATVAWSPNGIYMAVGCHSDPNVIIYKRSGDTFTRLTVPTPAAYGAGQSLAWSPDNTYLAIGRSGWGEKPIVMKRSGDTFTVIMLPTVYGGSTRGVSFSPDGLYLSSLIDASPFVKIYSRSGDTFTLLSAPASLPTGSSVNGNDYSINVNAAPFAPTWVAPADNSYQNRDASLLLDWDFTDGDAGDSMSAYALSKSVDGATLEYWNASTSAWVAAEVKNPTANTFTTLGSGWATAGESIEYKAKTWDAADAAGPYGSGLTVNAATATVPVLDAPATSALLAGSSAVIGWTVAAQAAYQVRVLSSADAELFSTGKVTGAVTEITLGYVFSDGATGLKVELTTWNAFDVPGIDTNTGISVTFDPPAVPVLTVTANAAGYLSVVIADPTPTGSQPTVDTHDVFVRVAAGGRQVGERTVGGDGIRISTGTVETNGTYLDYAAATGTDFEYRTLAQAGGATAYSAWT
jgi:WD40 repeat protein